jgi:hypothetical protein
MRRTVVVIVLGLAVASMACSKVSAPPGMAGTWQGKGEITCAWCKQREIGIEMTIAANGAVTGKIGDATLDAARLTRNVVRPDSLPTKFVVKAKLVGPLVASQGVTRATIDIGVDLTGEQLTGAFVTNGDLSGTKETSRLAGRLPGLTRR